MSVNAGAIPIGSRFGQYEILSSLGAGGMGEIYLAHDTRLGRRVALKLLPRQFTGDQERLRRFEWEAKATSALNHPNIVTIYEVGTTATEHGELRFIATEYVEGVTLRQRMSKSPLLLRETLVILQQIAGALDSAHVAGVVHRDIKPENVMIRRDGFVKVLDFGLAKLVESKRDAADEEAPTLALKTDPGKVMGTVSYMSPEQARGQDVDGRSDIFSIGILFYEMLTERLPFHGPSPTDVLAAILHKEPPALELRHSTHPAEINWIVAKALAKERDERYQTIKGMLGDLKRLQQRLDFAAELERSVPLIQPPVLHEASSDKPAGAPLKDPFRTESIDRTAANSNDLEPIERASGSGKTSAGNGTQVSGNVSSAEYLFAKINHHRRAVLTGLGLLTLAIAAGIYASKPDRPLDSLAVMPFVNVGKDSATAELSDNLTAQLINALAQLPKLKVKPLNIVTAYQGQNADLKALGAQLGAQAILVGRIAKREEKFAINVELVNAQDGSLIWGEQYLPKFADLLLVEQAITRDVAANLRLTPNHEAKDIIRVEAMQLYQTGRYYWNQRTTDGLRKALEQFQQALALDRGFALAHAGLADCYNSLAGYNAMPPREAFPQAKAAALRALALDGSLAEAHAALAVEAYQYDWDWVTAEQEFKRALELNTSYASAHQWYSTFLAVTNRPDEAIAAAKRTQQLDTFSLIINAHLGRILYYAGRNDEAVVQLQKTIALDNTFYVARRYLGQVYEEQGKHELAIAELQQSLSSSGDSALIKAELGHAYAVAGKRDAARQIINELQSSTASNKLSAYHIAVIYAGLGDKDAAFALLQVALEEKADRIAYLKVEPRLKPLRNDPRFAKLLQRIGL